MSAQSLRDRIRARAASGDTSWGIALWAIAIAAILFILDFGGTILLPTAYAIVLALVLAPIARGLARLGIGDGGSAVVTVLLAAGAIVGIITIVTPAVGGWAANAESMARTIAGKLQPIKDQIEIVEDVSKRISGEGSSSNTAVVASPGIAGVIVSTGANVVSQTIYILFLMLFLLSLRTDLRRRFILCPATLSSRLRMARAVRDVGKNVAAYLFTLTCINAGVAVVTAAAFYAAGLPDALVWGAVFGLANYIPVIGPTGAIAAAALVGLASEPTLVAGLMGAGIMLVINAIESQAVQPWLMSRRIEINPVALFVALAFFVWLWGVPAALISAPLLIIIYTFSKHLDSLSPIAAVLAPVTKPRREPPAPPALKLRLRRKAVPERERNIPPNVLT